MPTYQIALLNGDSQTVEAESAEQLVEHMKANVPLGERGLVINWTNVLWVEEQHAEE